MSEPEEDCCYRISKFCQLTFFLQFLTIVTAFLQTSYADYPKGYDLVTGMGEMTDKKVSYIYHFIFTFSGYVTNKFNGHLPVGLLASSTG